MARWHSCNVLYVGAETRHVWQFDARNGKFPLGREQASPPGEPLPARLVAKSWSTLWQPRLNVAWLPPEDVFLRVAQFPQSSPDETRSMVELQLEKLSPIPVTQALWTMHVLPHAGGNMQTVVVVIVSRAAVEKFLGELEGQGFIADRLELPVLDQVTAESRADGAWIYPEALGGVNTALVAWWSGGVLQNIDLLTISAGGDRAAAVKDQLVQMTWAGELEGWLTSQPSWRIVAEAARAAEWEQWLGRALEQRIDIVEPLSPPEVAGRTARRVAGAELNTSLLPPEFAAKYQQQFVDRLWMRGLGATIGLYIVGVLIYFVALAVLNYRTTAKEQESQSISTSYTNALQLEARYHILQQRQQLGFAALDSWKIVAETLPEDFTLDSLTFGNGKTLSLQGTAPDARAVLDYTDTLRKLTNFVPNVEAPVIQPMGATVRWSYTLELKQGAEP